MMMLTNTNSSRFDPDADREAAQSALRRGVRLDDLPTLALAHLRAGGERAEALSPYVKMYEELPVTATPELSGMSALFDVAEHLSEGLVALFRLRFQTADQRAAEAADRDRRIAERAATITAGQFHADRNAWAAAQRAREEVEREEAAAVRRAEAAVALLERALADELRVVRAAAKQQGAAR
jgi:hypothetical protein